MRDPCVTSLSQAAVMDVLFVFWRNPERKKQTCVFARAFMRHRSGRVALTDFPLLLLASSTEEERLCGEAFVVSTSLVFSGEV